MTSWFLFTGKVEVDVFDNCPWSDNSATQLFGSIFRLGQTWHVIDAYRRHPVRNRILINRQSFVSA